MTPAARAIVRFLAEQIAAQHLAEPPAAQGRFDQPEDVEQTAPDAVEEKDE